jgi:hypothetical protein
MTAPLDLDTARHRYLARLAREQCHVCGRTEGVDCYFPPADLGAPAELRIRCVEHATTPMPKAP